MGLPRSKYVREGQEGVYHCFSRCVRRAFLYGYDARTGRDFSHRKAWLVSRLRHLAGIFAVDVCAYAVMGNHYHVILRTCPETASSWSDQEVATRWLRLCPRKSSLRRRGVPSIEKQIRALMDCPGHIATLRRRLGSLSWFMGRLNEYIARAANKEDEVKGRFWESRFKCQALLDEAAIAACMVYVDLNPVRAGLARIPEDSDFTSIRERIRSWRKKTIVPDSNKTERNPQNGCVHTKATPDNFVGAADATADWLCPISSEAGRRGILSMTAAEYFDLVDKSGRLIRSDKRGAIEADLEPILLRIGANPLTWSETISAFGDKFSLVVGLLCNLRSFADQLGRQWFRGVSAARDAFALSPPQPA